MLKVQYVVWERDFNQKRKIFFGCSLCLYVADPATFLTSVCLFITCVFGGFFVLLPH